MIEVFATRWAYVAVFVLLAIGLYMVIANENLVKKIIGINLFQTAIFLLFVTAAYVRDGSAPVVPPTSDPGSLVIASPLPHVIVLTAIVVGVALTAVGLALAIRIHAEYGTLREDTLRTVRGNR